MNFIEKNSAVEGKPNFYYYQAIVERRIQEGIEEYCSYGIQAVQVTTDGCKVIEAVADVTVDLEYILSITDKFNRLQLSPVHLLEALDNELAVR